MDLQDQGVIDSGCSRHMTWNMSYLTDYEEIDGGYVAFGGNPKEGKITGKVYASQARKETEPVKDYIFLPLWTADPPFSQDPKSSHDDGSKPSSDDGKKVDEDPRKDINAVGGKISIELPIDLNMPALEDYSIFDFTRDDEDDGVVVDMKNLDITIQVSPIPTTRIHKDHHLDQVIRYLQSASQTRKMSKNLRGRNPKRSMIGSLMYLTSSRPDIMFAVCACARYQVNPKVSHLYAVKRIFRYLKGQPKSGLWYPKDSPFDLVAYTDSDYTGVSLDRKSTTRGCQFLRYRLISWQCKKQKVVANSTTEAEYVAASSCCR
ncbi:hypothetical protein Tco_0154675 [Tanacetum coccineum]